MGTHRTVAVRVPRSQLNLNRAIDHTVSSGIRGDWVSSARQTLDRSMRFFRRSQSWNLRVWLACIAVLAFGNVASAEQGDSETQTDVSASTTPATKAKTAKSSKAAGASSKAPAANTNTKATASKPKSKARARRERQPDATYVKLRDGWHAPVETHLTPTLPVSGRIPLVLARVNGGGDPVTLAPQREDGGFSDEDLQRAASAFAPKDAKVHPIAPRLLDLVYRAMRHFEAPLVHVVSGYRPDRAGSRHTQGRAIDMVLPGVTNEQLADYVRTYGFVGVGIYPKSGFVHLDVREASYFWVDNSLPTERSRSVPMMGTQAAAADRAAAARGEAPDTWVPDNDREDKAAAKSYARRAKLRRDRALRKQGTASSAAPESPSKAKSASKPTAAINTAGVFGELPP